MNDPIRTVAEHAVDAALIDFLLEDGEAWPLMKLLIGKDIPFAVCTGADIKELSAVFPDNPIIEKPYAVENVLEIVNDLLVLGAHTTFTNCTQLGTQRRF